MTRRRVALGAGGVLFLVVVAVVVFLRDVDGAQAALESARARVGDIRAAAATGQLEQAEEAVDLAHEDLAVARTRTDGALWWGLARIPVLGRSARVARRVVDVADEAIVLAGDVVASGDTLFDDNGQLQLRSTTGGLDLRALDDAESILTGLDASGLEAALQDLEGTATTWMPVAVRDGRRDVLNVGREALDTLARARDAVGAFRGFLGGDAPRRYFLAMQNPSELRGTGGLIGFFAVLTVDNGRFSMSSPEVYNVLNRDEEGELTPVPTSEEFARRYQHVAAAGFFANVNSDPDLPTTAEVMLDLYADRRGRELDGVVVADPVSLSMILESVGPVALPREAVDDAGRIPNPVPAEVIPQVTMIDAYEVFGGPSAERKEFLGLFAEAVFRQLFSTSWDAIGVANQAGKASGRRNLQVYSRDPDEQAVFDRLGVSGRMKPAVPGGDLLAVSANNAAGNKMDVHVAHHFRGDLRLTELASGEDGSVAAARQVDFEVALENPLPTSGRDLYIIGAHPPEVLGKGPEAQWSSPRGLNRTWFTVWAPRGTETFGATDSGGEPVSIGAGSIHGNRAFDYFLETPSESTRSFILDLGGPVELRSDGPDLVYDLTLWRQAKAIPDHWDLTFHAPDGWSIAAAKFEGGGDGQGMGVGGDGSRLELAWDAGGSTARLQGAATQDVHLTIRFSRGLWSRFVDWLNSPLF